MGNSQSKGKKIHDFSFPFMEFNSKSLDEWKALEEEKNKALQDKKRFAVRLSDVEELYAKKYDDVLRMENSILKMQSDSQRLEDQLMNTKLENKIIQIEKALALIHVLDLRKKNEDLTHIINNQEYSNQNDTIQPSKTFNLDFFISKLLSQIKEKEMNSDKLLEKLSVLNEEYLKCTCSDVRVAKKLPLKVSEERNSD